MTNITETNVNLSAKYRISNLINLHDNRYEQETEFLSEK